MFRKLLITICFIFTYNNMVNANENIYFINLNLLFNNSLFGKDVNKKIFDKGTLINKSIQDYEKIIKEEKIKLNSQKNVINDDEYVNKNLLLEDNISKYASDINNKKNDLEKFKFEANNKFLNELITILEIYSKENSIDMIFKKDSLLIVNNKFDLTNKILDLLNKKVKNFNIE